MNPTFPAAEQKDGLFHPIKPALEPLGLRIQVKLLLEAAQKDNPSGDESDDRLKLAPLLGNAQH